MLTPMDIQQKKFHVGLGYDKKDVGTFFAEVAKDFEQLFRSNAELTERVSILSDQLQNYKSKEAALDKSLMLAEKDSEDKKAKASREAKNIELDAKNKAKAIVSDAENRLNEIKEEIEVLKSTYAAYKSNFSTLLKKQFEFLGETDFDVDSYIDERAWSVIAGGGASQESSGDGSFGTFSGDPQMRDPSLGGLGSGISSFQSGGGFDNPTTSTSAVYTSALSANENFVDPFNPTKDNNRYNPFSKVTDEPKSKKPNNQSPKNSAPKVKPTSDKMTKAEPKTEEKAAPEKKEAPKETPKQESAPKAETKVEDIPPIQTPVSDPEPETKASDEVGLSGDVEEAASGVAMISDEIDNGEPEDDGFEFV